MERYLITEHGNILDVLTGCFFNPEGKFLRDVADYVELDWLVNVLGPADYSEFTDPDVTGWFFLWKTIYEDEEDNIVMERRERFFFLRRVEHRYEFRVVEKTSIAGKKTDDFGIALIGEVPTALPIEDTDINIGFLAYVKNLQIVPLVAISKPSSFKEAVESTNSGVQLWYNEETKDYEEVSKWHETLTVSMLKSRTKKVTNLMREL